MNKRKVLTIIQIIALVLATVGAVSLFVNSIHFFVYEMENQYFYKNFQIPQGIIVLFAAIASFAGIGACTAGLFVEEKRSKKKCFIISVTALAALAVLFVAFDCVWWIGDNVGDGLPYNPSTLRFAVYSSILSLYVQQLVFNALFTAPLIVNYIIDLKSAKKAQQIQSAEVTAQTEKENY